MAEKRKFKNKQKCQNSLKREQLHAKITTFTVSIHITDKNMKRLISSVEVPICDLEAVNTNLFRKY